MGRATCRWMPGKKPGWMFQPTPSSYGEGDPRDASQGRLRRHVSTHALLIWGGRRTLCPAECDPGHEFQPTPSSYGEGDPKNSGPHGRGSTFQPTPSSYGEGDKGLLVLRSPDPEFQPTPSSYGE